MLAKRLPLVFILVGLCWLLFSHHSAEDAQLHMEAAQLREQAKAASFAPPRPCINPAPTRQEQGGQQAADTLLDLIRNAESNKAAENGNQNIGMIISGQKASQLLGGEGDIGDDVTTCRHPGRGTMDVMRFYGVGGQQAQFRRQFQAVSSPDLRLWLNFYLCDEWRQETLFFMRVFLWRGVRIEFQDVFGLVWHSMSIYRSLGYIVNHHQYEGSLHQDKHVWESQQTRFDEFRTDIGIMFTQDSPDAPDGVTRTTTVKVVINGNHMPEFTFKGTRRLEVVQTAIIDCVSFTFDCAEVTEVTFSNLGPRAVNWADKFLPGYPKAIAALQAKVAASPPAPAPNTPKELVICVGIMSAPGRFDLRMAQRETWLQHPLVLSGRIVVKFFLSFSPSAVLQHAMEAEARAFGDIVFLPETEVYVTINYKVMKILSYFTSPEYLQPGVASVIGKTDDDVYVDVPNLYNYLLSRKGEAEGYTIFSSKETGQRPSTNWFWPTGETKEYSRGIPPYPTGTFYLVSAPLVLAWMDMELQTAGLATHPMEDRQTGIWAVQFERDTGKRVFWSDFLGVLNEDVCRDGALVVHHVLTEQIKCFHQAFLRHNRVVCVKSC